MRKLFRRFSRPSVIGGVAAAVIAVVGVFAFIEVSGRPPLGVGDVEGVWRGDGGESASVSIRRDGTASLYNVPEPCPPSEGGYYSGSASWEFYTVPDESPGILFRFPGEPKECRLSFSVIEKGSGFFTEDTNNVGYVRD